ncbi:ExbD/TolR family protein [Pelagibaculum spongiae]|uniref:Biopolymer transporter ExbD n=1 Tax=Pelagibaculum spongiae TaxID=2080658 RepID=A0A2V1GVC6_9GAMM|nr:biopolymer transporter ExbD [Pelagibaculum spongiae]PVZ68893.1 biopolymer transporter ExbD [Pelagibaculum spongiae]
MSWRAKTRRDELTPDMMPLIDVVFLLLIFFMVSTSFTRETQITLSLPQANGQPSEVIDAPKVLEVSVDAQGYYFVNSQKLVNNKQQTLQRAIEQQSGGDLTLPVIISADGQAPHQSVVTAMDVLGQQGFTKLRIATRKPDE